MAIAEDAASVLEQFVQDVANLPAEIAHLLEEIEAKDRVMQECRQTINARDTSIQKFLKQNGTRQSNPKDDLYTKTILSNYDKAHTIQDEKVTLTEKASTLLDRQIRRLDLKIRDLFTEGTIPPDPLLPSLLHAPNSRVPVSSHALHPITGNAPPSTTIANSALARLVPPPSTTPIPHPASAPIRTRESSLTASTPTLAIDHSKRRRLQLPASGSSLRQSSLGPGTPRTGTPSSVRGGSAGPGRGIVPKKSGVSTSGSSGVTGANKKVAPHQRVNSLNPNSKKLSSAARRRAKKAGGTGLKHSPSSTGDDSALSDESGSNHPGSQQQQGSISLAHPNNNHSNEDIEMGDSFAAEAEDDDEQSDDRKYCTCRTVSHGNMVACDNDECAYEWFHWSCVGISREPVGKWYCPDCRVKLGI